MEHPRNAHVQIPNQIIEFCKAKTIKSRHKRLAAENPKILSSTITGGRMSPVVKLPTGDASDPIPSWAEPISTAMT